jgi:hypothetical protein
MNMTSTDDGKEAFDRAAAEWTDAEWEALWKMLPGRVRRELKRQTWQRLANAKERTK